MASSLPTASNHLHDGSIAIAIAIIDRGKVNASSGSSLARLANARVTKVQFCSTTSPARTSDLPAAGIAERAHDEAYVRAFVGYNLQSRGASSVYVHPSSNTLQLAPDVVSQSNVNVAGLWVRPIGGGAGGTLTCAPG